MARRRPGQLVANEARVAVACLALHNHWPGHGERRFWSRDVQAELSVIEPGADMSDSTVSRTLHRLAAVGWLEASRASADPVDVESSRPRLYFRFTSDGLTAVRTLLAERRAQTPPWILHPATIVGEDIEGDRRPPVRRLSTPGTVSTPAPSGRKTVSP